MVTHHNRLATWPCRFVATIAIIVAIATIAISVTTVTNATIVTNAIIAIAISTISATIVAIEQTPRGEILFN